MNQVEGERHVKYLQKEFLCWVENHPKFSHLPSNTFNNVRRRVFRSTFDAFRLGVLGTDAYSGLQLWSHFFDWDGLEVEPDVKSELVAESFRVLLLAFRAGVMSHNAVFN